MSGELFPKDGPRPTSSRGERETYEALRDGLPHGWKAWHSIRLRIGHDYEGEGDFVIAAPELGLLVLEVKSGNVWLEEGRWMQNGRPMKLAPLDQARGFAQALIDEIRRRGGESPPFGVAAIFPDCEFSYDRGPEEGGIDGRVLGRLDLHTLARELPPLAQRVIRQRHAPPPAYRWIPKLDDIWGRNWVPHVSLATRVEDAERRRLELDEQQFRLLDSVMDNPRALVDGPAGSGKTVVARELCAREARMGKRVLYLCFADALAHVVDRSFEGLRRGGLDVHAAPVQRLAREWLASRGATLPPEADELWTDVSFRAALDALPGAAQRPDCVIVDEAQDLTESDWTLIEELTRDRMLWAFRDRRQNFWPERTVPARLFEGAMHFRLPTQHRNPKPVEWLSSRYRQELGSMPPPGAEATSADGPPPLGDALGLIVAEPGQDVLELARHQINLLRRDGARPEHIAVLSLGGRSRSRLFERTHLGDHELRRADQDDDAQYVVADTFLRFKGLDRPIVILLELELGHGDGYATRMHIATTRPTVKLLVLCTARELDYDQRLQLIDERQRQERTQGEGSAPAPPPITPHRAPARPPPERGRGFRRR